MAKTIALIVELVFVIIMLMLVFNMTATAMMIYTDATDSLYGTIDNIEQDAKNTYGDSTYDNMPMPARDILDGLLNFRI